MNNLRRSDDRPRARFVAYALLIMLPLAFIAGRATDPSRLTIREAEAVPMPRELPEGVDRFHDAAAGVTCWRAWKYRVGGAGDAAGISCLPDAALEAAWIEHRP